MHQVVARELQNPLIAADNITPNDVGSVSFHSDSLAAGYAANLWLRSAIRVLVLLAEGALPINRPAGDTVSYSHQDCNNTPDSLPTYN